MVTINFTLFVELVLFLIFLWGTNTFILRPTLKTIDEREQLVRHNEAATEEDLETSETLEKNYANQISRVYRETEEKFREARRKAIQKRTERVEQEMKTADTAILEFRQKVRADVEQQRSEAESMARTLADAMAERLQLGNRNR